MSDEQRPQEGPPNRVSIGQNAGGIIEIRWDDERITPAELSRRLSVQVEVAPPSPYPFPPITVLASQVDTAQVVQMADVLRQHRNGLALALALPTKIEYLQQFEMLFKRLALWSNRTFGDEAERGPAGPLMHMMKEVCTEIFLLPEDKWARIEEYLHAQLAWLRERGLTTAADPSEYADALILLMDAFRREFVPILGDTAGNAPGLARWWLETVAAKMDKNEGRSYPRPTGDAISEHDRRRDDELSQTVGLPGFPEGAAMMSSGDPARPVAATARNVGQKVHKIITNPPGGMEFMTCATCTMTIIPEGADDWASKVERFKREHPQ